MASIVGGGDPASDAALARSQRPIWPFRGGRDRLVPTLESLPMANARMTRGHRAARLTLHHDLDHDAWIRVHEGDDLCAWLLAQSLQRASPP